MANMDSPIPLSDIESVLAWVDSFKLSRTNKKINRDFSDAVLLAEILCVHYPKLVEMHNYPPRNSHALKLNNWMTLNRKVLKKLKLNLCCNTMDQLANCTPGVIERVLVMVRDKIRRDEEINKSMKETDQNLSSGGSYYEACGDDEHVLVVPVKTRINGILETVQQKVISYESYQALKEENKDAKDSIELLKQKVEHLDNLLKLKDERIDELQTQLDRKQARRKEIEAYQNSLAVPFETVPSPTITDIVPPVQLETNVPSLNNASTLQTTPNIPSKILPPRLIESANKIHKAEESKIPVLKTDFSRTFSKSSIESATERADEIYSRSFSKPSIESVSEIADDSNHVDRIKSDIFKDIEISDEKFEGFNDVEEFKDSEQNHPVTIEDTIQKEIKEIINHMENVQNRIPKD